MPSSTDLKKPGLPPVDDGLDVASVTKRPDLTGLHPNLVLVTNEQKFHVLGDRARSQLAARPGYYSLLVSLSGMLVFAKDRGLESSGPRARVLMAGEIISPSTVVDVIGMVASHRWRGEFQIVTGMTHFQLLIDQGTLLYAASNRPEDELHHWIADLVSKEELALVRSKLLPGQRLEDVLVSRKLLTSNQLHDRAEQLAKKVFFDALTLADGKYAFMVLPEALNAPPPVSLRLQIQEMILLGVERIDENALFRQRIPHGQVRPRIIEQPGAVIDDSNQRLVMMHANGEHTLDEIARASGLVEFECLKATWELIEAGHLNLEIEELIDVYAVQALLKEFSIVLRCVSDAITKVGRLDVLQESVRQWVESSGFASYLGQSVAETLKLDADEICARLRTTHIENPVAALKQALFDLVTFAMFVTSTQLPQDQAVRLTEHVQHSLTLISERWR